jgi:hypothetical protein
VKAIAEPSHACSDEEAKPPYILSRSSFPVSEMRDRESGSDKTDLSTLQVLVVGVHNAGAMTSPYANELDACFGHVAQWATSRNWKLLVGRAVNCDMFEKRHASCDSNKMEGAGI